MLGPPYAMMAGKGPLPELGYWIPTLKEMVSPLLEAVISSVPLLPDTLYDEETVDGDGGFVPNSSCCITVDN
jgi:hypothetical protein